MLENGVLYQKQVYLLSQTFFIKDNKDELLLCAHKYDFDIVFFDQLSAFVEEAQSTDRNKVFVIDLDVLHNVQADLQHQRRQTMFLSDLLPRLPGHRSYVYLQTPRQGERFILQQKLVDSNCLAYAEKPITNAALVDKLFTLFPRARHGETNSILFLADYSALNLALLAEKKIDLLLCENIRTLHTRVKEMQPDIVIIDEAHYAQTEAIVRILKKNIEFDPGCEIFILQNSASVELSRRAFQSGFDGVYIQNDADVLSHQLINRIQKIRVSKDLISRDRATGLLNKVGLQKKALHAIRRAEREEISLAYGVIDIDKFKSINDTWGHFFGDIVIKRLSLVLAAQVGEFDLLSRFGGEEFVILFWNCSLAQGMQKMGSVSV